jgi:tRNA(fMet)-specific endonuclease VapC
MICIDTSVLIDFFRKKEKSKTWLYKLSSDYHILAVTSISVFEIYSGCNSIQIEFWNRFFQNKVILPLDVNAAKQAVIIDQYLKKQRKQIAIPDLFIAACVLENNLPFATLNNKDFERIPNLILLDNNS